MSERKDYFLIAVSVGILVTAATLVLAKLAAAGPPFRTDDPEPVDYQHWEIYGFSQGTQKQGDTSGILPAVEVNYGAAPNLQLHVVVPFGSFDKPNGSTATKFGYNNGDYTTRPRFLKIASVFFGIATAGGTLNYQHLAATREKADQLVDARLAAPMTADANDFLWQWGSSVDYDAAPGLDRIEASRLAINSAADERNPPETGLMVGALKRVKHGKLDLIPASEQTSGHLTTGNAKFYAKRLRELLKTAPRRAM